MRPARILRVRSTSLLPSSSLSRSSIVFLYLEALSSSFETLCLWQSMNRSPTNPESRRALASLRPSTTTRAPSSSFSFFMNKDKDSIRFRIVLFLTVFSIKSLLFKKRRSQEFVSISSIVTRATSNLQDFDKGKGEIADNRRRRNRREDPLARFEWEALNSHRYILALTNSTLTKNFPMFGRTLLMFTALTALLMILGFVIGLATGLDPISLMFIGLVFAAVINLTSYLWSDRFVLWSTHTRLISEADNPQLYGIVRRVAEKANIPMPRVGVVESNQPNAFATGRGPKKSIVVATTGILRVLTPGELEAVIGHEISHVTHRDVLVASIAATVAGTISFLGQMILWNSIFGGFGGGRRGGNQSDNNGAILLMIIAAILVPIAAMLIQLGISRGRESEADASGARLTEKPQELINALRKISNRATVSQWNQGNAPSPATSALWIVNPLKGSSWTEIFSTHPSLEHRIQRITRVAQDMGVFVS